MDIKILLLKSLSLKQPISGCYRIHYGKYCFILRYVVNGKILNISSIKRRKKCVTWSHRIRQQHSFYTKRRRLQNKKFAKNINGFSISKEVQTEIETLNQPSIRISSKTSSTQCPLKAVTTSAQQTIPSIRYSHIKVGESQINKIQKITKSSQTDLNTDSKGVQCKHYTSKNGTQTDENVRNSSTQIQIDFCSGEKCEKFIQTNESMMTSVNAKELDIIIYMLNEIGETMIDQSQILNNTNEILKKVRHINHLEKSNPMKNIWRRRRLEYKRFNQNKNKLKDHPPNFLEVYTQKSDKSMQTDEVLKLETVNAFTQTVVTLFKSRKLCFLKKNK